MLRSVEGRDEFQVWVSVVECDQIRKVFHSGRDFQQSRDVVFNVDLSRCTGIPQL